MKQPTKRKVIFHGVFAERYVDGVEIGADSVTNLLSLLFKEVLPTFLENEKKFSIAFEDSKGNMTELFDHLMKQSRPVAAFPVHEYWMDIGRLDDFQRANDDAKHLD